MKYLAILPLLILSISINAQIKVLSRDQYFITTDEWRTDEGIGFFYPSFVVGDTTGQSFSFSITDNPHNAYAIHSTTGALSVHDNTGLSVNDIDYIRVRVTLGSYYEDYYAIVAVWDEDSTYYIDIGGSGSDLGTYDDPFLSWSDSYLGDAGHTAILFNCGSIISSRINITSSYNGTAPNLINRRVLGAYGNGNRPNVDVTGQDNITVRGSYWFITRLYLDNGYGLRVHGDTWSEYIIVSDLKFNDCEDNGQLYFNKQNAPYYRLDQHLEAYNIESNDAGSDAHEIKVEATGVIMWNAKGYGNASSHCGLSVPIHCASGDFSHILAYNNDRGIEISGKNCTLEDFISRNNYYNNLEVSDSSVYNLYFHRGIVKDNSSGSNVNIIPNTVGNDGGRLIVLDSLEITGGASHGIYLGDEIDNVTIQKCKIYSNTGDGIRQNDSGNDTLKIYNNMIYLNSDGIEAANFGSFFQVYNNVIVKNSGYSFNNSDGTAVEFRNNGYNNYTGNLSPMSNNNANTTVYTDYGNNDFSVTDSTKSTVDAGYYWVHSFDYFGNPVSTNPDSIIDIWDIGSEFQWSGVGTITSTDWTTIKINLTQTDSTPVGWNNMTTRTKYDSIQLRAADDTLTESYFVIMQDSLYLAGTQGNEPYNYSTVSQVYGTNWYWGGSDSQVFKITNVPYGYYNLYIYGSKAGSSQDLDVIASIEGSSTQYNAADNDTVFEIEQFYHEYQSVISATINNESPCLTDTMLLTGDASNFYSSRWYAFYSDGSPTTGTFEDPYNDTSEYYCSEADLDSVDIYFYLTGYDQTSLYLTIDHITDGSHLNFLVLEKTTSPPEAPSEGIILIRSNDNSFMSIKKGNFLYKIIETYSSDSIKFIQLGQDTILLPKVSGTGQYYEIK